MNIIKSVSDINFFQCLYGNKSMALLRQWLDHPISQSLFAHPVFLVKFRLLAAAVQL
jgi:hypothetical protein